jgi:hypothetical protein
MGALDAHACSTLLHGFIMGQHERQQLPDQPASLGVEGAVVLIAMADGDWGWLAIAGSPGS